MPTGDHDALLDVISADFGPSVEYEATVSEAAEERYAKRVEDYANAHAEAEAGLQDLSAG